MAERRTGSGGGTLQGGNARSALNFHAFCRFRQTAAVDQFEHQCGHRIDAGVARTDEADRFALSGQFQRKAHAGLFRPKVEIMPSLAIGKRAKQIDIERIGNKISGLRNKR